MKIVTLSPVFKVAFPYLGNWGNGELGEGFEVLPIGLLCEQGLVLEIVLALSHIPNSQLWERKFLSCK